MSETAQGETPKSGCGECLCGGTGPVLTEFLKRMGPPEGARRHFDQARVEFLKGVRALIAPASSRSLPSTNRKAQKSP